MNNINSNNNNNNIEVNNSYNSNSNKIIIDNEYENNSANKTFSNTSMSDNNLTKRLSNALDDDINNSFEVEREEILKIEKEYLNEENLRNNVVCVELSNNNRIYINYKESWNIFDLIKAVVNHKEFNNLYSNSNWVFNAGNYIEHFDLEIICFRNVKKHEYERKIDYNTSLKQLRELGFLKDISTPFFSFLDNKQKSTISLFNNDNITKCFQDVLDTNEMLYLYKNYLPRVNSMYLVAHYPEFLEYFKANKVPINTINKIVTNSIIYNKVEWLIYDDEALGYLIEMEDKFIQLEQNIKCDFNNEIYIQDKLPNMILKSTDFNSFLINVIVTEEISMKIAVKLTSTANDLIKSINKKLNIINKKLIFEAQDKILKVKNLCDYIFDLDEPLGKFVYIQNTLINNGLVEYKIIDNPFKNKTNNILIDNNNYLNDSNINNNKTNTKFSDNTLNTNLLYKENSKINLFKRSESIVSNTCSNTILNKELKSNVISKKRSSIFLSNNLINNKDNSNLNLCNSSVNRINNLANYTNTNNNNKELNNANNRQNKYNLNKNNNYNNNNENYNLICSINNKNNTYSSNNFLNNIIDDIEDTVFCKIKENKYTDYSKYFNENQKTIFCELIKEYNNNDVKETFVNNNLNNTDLTNNNNINNSNQIMTLKDRIKLLNENKKLLINKGVNNINNNNNNNLKTTDINNNKNGKITLANQEFNEGLNQLIKNFKNKQKVINTEKNTKESFNNMNNSSTNLEYKNCIKKNNTYSKQVSNKEIININNKEVEVEDNIKNLERTYSILNEISQIYPTNSDELFSDLNSNNLNIKFYERFKEKTTLSQRLDRYYNNLLQSSINIHSLNIPFYFSIKQISIISLFPKALNLSSSINSIKKIKKQEKIYDSYNIPYELQSLIENSSSLLTFQITFQLFVGKQAISEKAIIHTKALSYNNYISHFKNKNNYHINKDNEKIPQNILINKTIKFKDIKYNQLPLFTSIIINIDIVNNYKLNNKFKDLDYIKLGWLNFKLFDHRRQLKTGLYNIGLKKEEFGDYGYFNWEDNNQKNIIKKNSIYIRFRSFNKQIVNERKNINEIKKNKIISYVNSCSISSNHAKIIDDIKKLTPFEQLNSNQKAILWYNRYAIANIPELLAKLIQSVDFKNYTCLDEIDKILNCAKLLDPISAIQILTGDYLHEEVRNYAVRCLKQVDYYKMSDYIIQLVQSLKYEPNHNSILGDYLLTAAVKYPATIGHSLFWCLKSEMYNVQIQQRFGLMLEVFLTKIERLLYKNFENEVSFIDHLLRIADIPFDCMYKDKSKKDLMIKNYKQELDKIDTIFFGNEKRIISLPINFKIRVKGILADKCKIMKSKKRPLWIALKSIDDTTEYIMFKKGDDLRQDILTIQLFKIMQNLWLEQGIKLKMSLYSVVSTGYFQGMLEMVKNSETLATIHKIYGGATAAFSREPLKKWFEDNVSLGQSEYISNFKLSCAAYCISTFVLGVGDRHNDNIMVKKNGELFHIDFGHFLGHFKYKYGFKRERAPFVFTKEFKKVLGGKKSLE